MELDEVSTFVTSMEDPSSLFLDLEMSFFSLTLRLETLISWLSLKISRSLNGETTTMENLDLEKIVKSG